MSTFMRRTSVPLIAGLLAVPAAALAGGAPAKAPSGTSGYKVKVRVEFSGGRQSPIYVGDPLRVSLHKAGGSQEHFELCWTPAPIEQPSCSADHKVNGAGRPSSPAKAGLQKLRFKIKESGRIIVKRFRVLDPPKRK